MSHADLPFAFDSVSPPEAAVLVTVPEKIDSKVVLLDELAQRLSFPDYFGGNWDSFEECIRDLSWLPRGTLVLKHVDLPLADDVSNARTYLSILADAVARLSRSPDHSLVVIFPSGSKGRIAWLLRSVAFERRRV